MNAIVRDAAYLLSEDVAFLEACKRLKAAYFQHWENSKTPEERERLFMACSQVDDVMVELKHLRDYGKIEEARIDRMTKRSAR